MSDLREGKPFWLAEILVMILTVSAVIVLIYTTCIPHADTRFNNEMVLKFTDGWDYVSPSGEKRTVDLPCDLQENITDGIRISHILPQGNGRDYYNCLAFYNAFTKSSVYYNGALIYTTPTQSCDGRYFDRTTDSYWSIVRLPSTPYGGTITMEITSPYSSYRNMARIMLGTKASILFRLREMFMWQIVIAVMISVFGVITISFFFSEKKPRIQDKSVIFLGLFQLWTGAWEYSESYLFQFTTGNAVFVNALSFISVRMAALSFMVFAAVKIRGHWKKWNMIVILALSAEALIDTILQVTHIADFHDTIQAMNLLVLITALTVITEISVNYFRDKNRESRILFESIAILAAFAIAAIFEFCFDTRKYMSFIVGTGILIFIIMNAVNEIRTAVNDRKLAVIAEHYKVLSETDHMTGCANRLAMDEFMKVYEVYPQALKSRVATIIADVDHLKAVNDRFGHLKGDEAICETAELLKQHFAAYGICCRVGGDEFVCLLKNMSEKEIIKCIDEIDAEAVRFSQSREYRYSVSTGYAVYNAKHDRSFQDTLSRADAWMYRIKKKRQEKL